MTNELTRGRIERAIEHAEKNIKVFKGALIDLQKKYTEEPEMFLEGEYEADFNYIKDGIEDYETFLTLANAELERQSVTDEEVAEAIRIMQGYSTHHKRNNEPKYGKMFDLAIAALQAYRPIEVTDEKISEAISYFKRLKVYAIEWEKVFPEMPQALDMADLAIKALEAYRPEREEV